MEKGLLSYTENPVKANDRPSLATPLPLTFNSQGNVLKLAFGAQSAIGWENFVKGRVAGELTTFVR
jgi:hypothetical protein